MANREWATTEAVFNKDDFSPTPVTPAGAGWDLRGVSTYDYDAGRVVMLTAWQRDVTEEASAEARDMLRDMPWRRGGDALVTRLDRAALGEP